MPIAQDPIFIQKLRAMHPFRLFMYIALIGIGIMFGFLIVAFWFTNNIKTFYLPKSFTISTLLIILSSGALLRTKFYFLRDEPEKLNSSIITTFVFGALFIIMQFVGWQEMQVKNIHLAGAVNGAYLYIISGLHLAHFIGGVIFLIFVLKRVYKSKKDIVFRLVFSTDPYQLMIIQLLSLYWHFMGFLWLMMYLIFFSLTF